MTRRTLLSLVTALVCKITGRSPKPVQPENFTVNIVEICRTRQQDQTRISTFYFLSADRHLYEIEACTIRRIGGPI